MPSAFAYLPPASHALQFIVCYQQFTITMFFTPLLISLPYSSVRVTSRDGCSLIFTKTFYIMLRFARIVRPGPSFFSPTSGADTAQICESFIFRFLSMVQKLHSSVKRWLIKAPPPLRPPCKQTRPLQRLLIGCKVHTTRLFPSFPAFCCVHFLTLINNLLTISQRANRKTSVLFVSVVSGASSVFLSAKLIPLYQTNKII